MVINNNMDTNMNNTYSNQTNTMPVKSSYLDGIRRFFSTNKSKLVSTVSVLVALIMTGSVFYVAYSTYNSKENVASKIGAANPSCYIELSLATPVPIECKASLDIMLVIDRSSTMTDIESDQRLKLEWAKDAAKNLVQTVINSGSKTVRIGVTSFGAQANDGTGILDPIYNSTLEVPLSLDLQDVASKIDNITYKKNGTCIECGLKISNSQLSNSRNRRIVILLSDGIANHTWSGVRTSAASDAAINAANAGRKLGIEYRVLGYGQGSNINESTLISIAGSSSNYQYKPNASDWSSAFLNILKDICKVIPSPTPKSTIAPTPRPITLSVTEDSYVVSGASTNKSNYGTKTNLVSDGSPASITLMKFNLTNVSYNFTYAALRMNVNDLSVGEQNLYSTSSTWSERLVNYSNRPTVNTALLTKFTARANGVKEVDITDFIKKNIGKVVTLMITSSNADSFGINSREAATGQPSLYIR